MNQLAPGKLIGQRYQLVQSISAGGMGQVFKAIDTRLFNRPVAVKLLHQNLAGDADTQRQLRKRFAQEIRISTLLGEHPFIVKVLDYGLENNQPYLVMEYLTGHSLGELMLKYKPMPPNRVVNIARQVCAGLYYAHSLETNQDGHLVKGVIHRDIKPSNIFAIKDETLGETVKILDFGIAKLLSDVSIALGTQTTGFLGTVRYASPEQVRGEELDARSDIYSFGVVLYRMLTGQQPLRPKTDSFPGWYDAHNYQPPQPFDRSELPYDIPAELEQVVLSCLAKDPDQRPQNMKTLSAQLEGSLQLENTASPIAPISPMTPPTTSIFSERTLAAMDGREGTHLLASPPESKIKVLPLWVGIALFVVISGGTFLGLRLLLTPAERIQTPPVTPELPDTEVRDPSETRDSLEDWLLRDPQGELVFEDDPAIPDPPETKPESKSEITEATPEPNPSPPPTQPVAPVPVAPVPTSVAPQPPPPPSVATPTPPSPVAAPVTPVPAQPINQPLFPQGNPVSPPAPTPTAVVPDAAPTPSRLQQLRENREHLGGD
ncbi:serine/threonine protein kinase [Synechococcus sp. Nb3U1]|uniref:serine/threonine-protein kinase n=1 Tax=Synechococcus sp. Nb3U1 TaxID=1914529 RepID=UPI001F3FB5AD|nr:serine/threonine-protein kinase [Synechococcus sp. Nb3U1]MCF2971617.1 serine/threonine protein kinase [Synechococcus sp. Nb3U1]